MHKMFMKQDWLMRQIEMISIAIAKLLFGKGNKEYDLKEELGQKQSAELNRKLTSLLHEGRLGDAEDLLFSRLDPENKSILAAAIEFYQEANLLSDSELEAQGFTRSELWDGLGEVVEQYGIYIPGFWDEK